ncbi:MAG: exo-alpha-sialidase, partial [Acidobacteriota bacterium]|nr:exo-alpha-sialidase [Acidobacteriota bacterium]
MILALILAALLAPVGALCRTLERAPHAQIFTLTRRPGYFSEPSVAVNPLNPQQVAAAFQVKDHIAYSTDAGLHWRLAQGVPPLNYRVSGDVSVVYDNKGHAILCSIAFDKLGSDQYWGHNATRNGIFVRRSLDGGATWEQKLIAVIKHPSDPGIPFEDKPYIVADDTRGPFAGNLYIGWTHFTLKESEIYFSRSTDDGVTWSHPIVISTHPGLPRDDNGDVEGFTGAVTSDGALSVVWTDGNHIVFTQSLDGGRTFAASHDIIQTAPPYFGISRVPRCNGFPEIVAGPRGRSLYVTWSGYRNGDVDVFASASRDGGRTWSHAVRVNTDALHDGSDHFFQWPAVDPVSGDLYVIFYDRRGDPANHDAIIALARSTDGGATFKDYAWSVKPFDASGEFIGDYTGIAAFNGHVWGAW